MPEVLFPDPPLADQVVLLRAWCWDDVPAKMVAVAACPRQQDRRWSLDLRSPPVTQVATCKPARRAWSRRIAGAELWRRAR